MSDAATLKRRRESLGLTQHQLAKALGVSGYRTVSKWENQERAIPGPVMKLTAIWADPKCPARYLPKLATSPPEDPLAQILD